MSLRKTLLLLAAIFILCLAVFFIASKVQAPAENTAEGNNNTQEFSCSTILAEDSIPLPLNCTEDIGNSAGVVTLTVATSGRLEVMHGDKLVFINPIVDAKSGETLLGDHLSYDGTELVKGAFQFQDLTYDGHQDIVFLVSAGAYNLTYQYYAFDPARQTYASKPILEATNPSIDAEAHTISSFFKGRGLGDIYVATTHRFENGSYILVKRESQDMIGDSPEAGYLRITEELVNGALVETKRETLSEAGVRSNESPE